MSDSEIGWSRKMQASKRLQAVKILERDTSILEVDDNLFRITLPQPFYSPNHLYLVRDEKPLLIDSGYVESLGHLGQSLKHLGLSLNKLHTVFYTHPHIDHISGGLLMRSYAPKLRRIGFKTMPGDITDYIDYSNAIDRDNSRILRMAFRDRESATKRVRRSEQNWKRFSQRFTSVDGRHQADRQLILDELLDEESVIETGRHTFRILETPGHCKWHITPYEKSKKWIFTGDLIIGNIPAIFDQIDGSLEDYYSTMTRLLGFSNYRMFPAHGDEITQPSRRIQVVIKTLGILEQGILRRLEEKARGLLELMESAMGMKAEGGHFTIALALIESILNKLTREGRVKVTLEDGDYREFGLTGSR